MVVVYLGGDSMKIERPVALSEVADFSFIREVQKEMGIKPKS